MYVCHMNSKNKTPPAGQNFKPPVAPPVYRPQPTPKVLQLKNATKPQPTNAATSARKQPVPPPVYRPQPTPRVLQQKKPAAPPVYRPQAAPKVLQKKTNQPTHAKPATPNPRPMPRNANSGVIQPMIAILKDNLNDIHIWHQVYNMLKKHPDEEVEVLEHIKQVKPEDRLAIVGHGNEKTIGKWYSPNILANQLGKMTLPQDLKRIEILACRSGVGDQNSFAAGLFKQLMGKHNVVGYRGDNFTTGGGKNRAEVVGTTVADYFRNMLREIARSGKMPSNLATQITLAHDPLEVMGLSGNMFEGM